MCSGSSTACADGSTIYSAAVPCGRRHCPFQIQTRSPMRLVTPGPTLSISPAPSLWGMISGVDIGAVRPLRDFQSDGFAPEVFRLRAPRPDQVQASAAHQLATLRAPVPALRKKRPALDPPDCDSLAGFSNNKILCRTSTRGGAHGVAEGES